MSKAANSFDQIKGGEFKRTATSFHNTIEEGGEFAPEAGRYALYVCYACPWAHRCLITRAIKGLTKVIDVIAVDPVWGVVDEETQKKSWVFTPGGVVDGISVEDSLYQQTSLRGIYEIDNPDYEGRYTVPILFDKKTKRIVNNESSEIIRILNSKFDTLAEFPLNSILPASIPVAEIEAANEKMYNTFNNGVYRAGFAQSQEAHEEGAADVFNYLVYINDVLAGQRFVCGEEFSEADIRLWVTACRFDPVYHTHFKCAQTTIRDGFPHLFGWMCDVYVNVLAQVPGGAETYSETHIKQHYYRSHPLLNKFAIVPNTGYNPLNKLEDAQKEAQKRAEYLFDNVKKSNDGSKSAGNAFWRCF